MTSKTYVTGTTDLFRIETYSVNIALIITSWQKKTPLKKTEYDRQIFYN